MLSINFNLIIIIIIELTETSITISRSQLKPEEVLCWCKISKTSQQVGITTLPMSKCTGDGYPKATTLIITQNRLQFMDDVVVVIIVNSEISKVLPESEAQGYTYS